MSFRNSFCIDRDSFWFVDISFRDPTAIEDVYNTRDLAERFFLESLSFLIEIFLPVKEYRIIFLRLWASIIFAPINCLALFFYYLLKDFEQSPLYRDQSIQLCYYCRN